MLISFAADTSARIRAPLCLSAGGGVVCRGRALGGGVGKGGDDSGRCHGRKYLYNKISDGEQGRQ